MAGIDEITRMLDNFYKRIFEQSPARQNRVQSNAQVLNDTMPASDDTGSIGSAANVGADIAVTSRWYGPLTIAGTDQEANTSIYKIQSGSGRITYGAGMLDETTMTVVFRLRPDAAHTALASGYLFSWLNDASNYLRGRFNTTGDVWTVERAATGGAAAQSHTVAASFASGDQITVAFKFTSSTIGISINGGAFSMGGGSADIPVITAAVFDLLSSAGAAEWFNGGVYWVLITPTALTDAQIAAIHGTGNTDPEWNGVLLNGINLGFLWHCDDNTTVNIGGSPVTGVQYHEPMSNVWGEGNWNA